MKNISVFGLKDNMKKKLSGWPEGIRSIGDNFWTANANYNRLDVADCFIQFNILNPYRSYHRPRRGKSYQVILDSKKPFLVIEEGVFRQFSEYKRVGWWSYKRDKANFNNENADNTRWNEFVNKTGITIKDWHSPGENILIMGQLDGDSSLIEMIESGYETFFDWTIDIIKKIRKHTDRNIVFRPHPKSLINYEEIINELNKDYGNITLSQNKTTPLDYDITKNGGNSLYDDFKKSHCVITLNSNSAIEAICEGIPVFALDKGSMAYDVAHTNLSEIENLRYDMDLTQWCNEIAYTIWNDEEIKTGQAWKHLRPVYF